MVVEADALFEFSSIAATHYYRGETPAITPGGLVAGGGGVPSPDGGAIPQPAPGVDRTGATVTVTARVVSLQPPS